MDQICEGMFLEAQHEFEPDFVWLVRVIENVGGRLLLRYEGSESAVADYWLFYIHHRLHPIGWAAENNCQMKPPKGQCSDECNFNFLKFDGLVFAIETTKRGTSNRHLV